MRERTSLMSETKSAMTGKKRPRILVALAVALALAFGTCGNYGCAQQGPQENNPAGETPQKTELQIFAANSLEKALPQVQELYVQKNQGVTFADTQFKASGDLVEQIKAGATPDLLVTASAGSMDTASSNGSIDDATRKTMFENDLVLVCGTSSDVSIQSLSDVTRDDITAIAIGDGETVPAGQYANQALNTIGMYSDASGKGGSYDSSFEPKVRTASSVGNAAKYVESGDCQIGFVYSSDLYRYSGIKTAFTVPSSAHKPIVYPGAVLKSSANADAAADFLDFCLNDPDAQRVWSQYGFEVA